MNPSIISLHRYREKVKMKQILWLEPYRLYLLGGFYFNINYIFICFLRGFPFSKIFVGAVFFYSQSINSNKIQNIEHNIMLLRFAYFRFFSKNKIRRTLNISLVLYCLYICIFLYFYAFFIPFYRTIHQEEIM